MAEMQTADKGSKKGGKVRSKKMSTRIDFTPMVDLGFLLITFFMLTTTLSRPTSMDIILPEDRKEPPKKDDKKTEAQTVLTLLLGKDDKVYYYTGIDNVKLDSFVYSDDSIRAVIRRHKDHVRDFLTNRPGGWQPQLNDDGTPKGAIEDEAICLIKPTEESRYKNMVDMLDEMHISKVKRYVLMDASQVEVDFIKNPAAGLKFNPTKQPEGGQ
jgi:biopolymer transport protein ExbD